MAPWFVLWTSWNAHADGPSIRFEKEKIKLCVQNGFCVLTGDYYFTNDSPDTAVSSMYYPVASGADLPFPRSFKVFDLYTGKNVDFRKAGKGIFFKISIPPLQTRTFRVVYEQATASNRFEYVLTSTASWGRPIETSDFLLVLGKGHRLCGSSLPFVQTAGDGKQSVYSLHRDRFSPTRNLELQWGDR